MTATEKAAQYFIDKFKSYVGYYEKATNAQLEDFTAKVFDIDDAEAAFEAQISGKWHKILIRCNKLYVE